MAVTKVSPYMTRPEVAEYLQVPVGTLVEWAYRSKGPKFRRVGRHVRYRQSDVDAWVEQQDGGGVPEPRTASK